MLPPFLSPGDIKGDPELLFELLEKLGEGYHRFGFFFDGLFLSHNMHIAPMAQSSRPGIGPHPHTAPSKSYPWNKTWK